MSSNPKQDIGAKKAPLELVPPALSIAASAALANGAEKYGAYNYREAGVRASIYYAAILRHLSAWWDGEEIAADSGVDHLAHVAAGLAILLDTRSIGRMVDDRPPTGGAAAMLAVLDKSVPTVTVDKIRRTVRTTEQVQSPNVERCGDCGQPKSEPGALGICAAGHYVEPARVSPCGMAGCALCAP